MAVEGRMVIEGYMSAASVIASNVTSARVGGMASAVGGDVVSAIAVALLSVLVLSDVCDAMLLVLSICRHLRVVLALAQSLTLTLALSLAFPLALTLALTLALAITQP